MTKNNFIALATALKAQMPVRTGPVDFDGLEHGMWIQWRADVLAVMNVCTNWNPRFHKGKFLAACGVPNLLME